jgi:uncharacterized protein
MKSIIVNQKDITPALWSGGQTTELFIYPKSSNYNLRNFDFRISTATIEIERSEFTQLESYKRLLMILKGEIEISHNGLLSKKLKSFEIYKFNGDIQTSAFGRCTDFNLMTSDRFRGTFKHIKVKKGQSVNFKTEKDSVFNFLYLPEGNSTLQIETIHYQFITGDFLCLESSEDSIFKLTSNEIDSNFVLVSIFKNSLD